MRPTVRNDLYILSGASCVGKTTAATLLFQREEDYLVMESDLLWCDYFDTPEDNYRKFRETWMNICASISQCKKPVVLCGCGIPEQFECCEARRLFDRVHYIALVAEDQVMEDRIRRGRGITDEKQVTASLHFNRWLRENGDKISPPMELVDNSTLTPEETARRVDGLIRRFMEERKKRAERIGGSISF